MLFDYLCGFSILFGQSGGGGEERTHASIYLGVNAPSNNNDVRARDRVLVHAARCSPESNPNCACVQITPGPHALAVCASACYYEVRARAHTHLLQPRWTVLAGWLYVDRQCTSMCAACDVCCVCACCVRLCVSAR